ncbi:protein containing SET domain protein [Teratosphaeria destructans]|uniref:Protein containing SET domain protein n=1 Tax=Teratosphaeria destructans TaxID=418781 RepID=A0A9W7SYU5_9PEZI|nr:protein containing SET domain protein [Teratosphaeria destructans]
MASVRGDGDSDGDGSSSSDSRCLLNDATDDWDFDDWTEDRSQIHGRGVFTEVDLRVSEIVFMERPLLQISAPELDVNLNPPRAATNDLLTQAAALSRAEKWSLISILRAHTVHYVQIASMEHLEAMLKETPRDEPDLSDVEKQLWAAVYVQGSRLNGASRQEYYQLFSDFRLLNHSCNPNAEAAWNPELKLVVVRAIQAMEQNEEVTISYLQYPLPNRAERWNALRFRCRCAKCALSGTQLRRSEASDKRLFEAFARMQLFKNSWMGRHRRSDFHISSELAEAIFTSGCNLRIIDPVVVIFDSRTWVDRARPSHLQSAYQGGFLWWLCSWIPERGRDHAYLFLAFKFVVDELQMLAICLGYEHPKTRGVFQTAWGITETCFEGREREEHQACLQDMLRSKCWMYSPEKGAIERLGYWNE